MGARRLDADFRRRKPGALLEGESAVRGGVEEWAAPAGSENGARLDRKTQINSGYGTFERAGGFDAAPCGEGSRHRSDGGDASDDRACQDVDRADEAGGGVRRVPGIR